MAFLRKFFNFLFLLLVAFFFILDKANKNLAKSKHAILRRPAKGCEQMWEKQSLIKSGTRSNCRQMFFLKFLCSVK